jgi:hypothetical protein
MECFFMVGLQSGDASSGAGNPAPNSAKASPYPYCRDLFVKYVALRQHWFYVLQKFPA